MTHIRIRASLGGNIPRMSKSSPFRGTPSYFKQYMRYFRSSEQYRSSRLQFDLELPKPSGLIDEGKSSDRHKISVDQTPSGLLALK
jgi:hypothetical protein